MSYLGKTELKSSDIRRFNATGSTSATHTLTWIAPNEQSLFVTINGVKQQEDAYSVSGVTLTLTSALVAADKLEVVGIIDVGQAVVPGTGVILNEHVNASAAIALSKLATDPSNATNLASGTVPTARLGSGTADATTFLRGDQSYAAAGGGKVAQVVSTTDNTAVTVTSTSYVELSTTFRATITPSATSSKILLLATLGYGQMGGVSNNQLGIKMMRDGTTLVGELDTLRSYDYGGSGILVELIASKVFLDSPATTSAITYSWYGKNPIGTQVINDDTKSTNITLLEITA